MKKRKRKKKELFNSSYKFYFEFCLFVRFYSQTYMINEQKKKNIQEILG